MIFILPLVRLLGRDRSPSLARRPIKERAIRPFFSLVWLAFFAVGLVMQSGCGKPPEPKSNALQSPTMPVMPPDKQSEAKVNVMLSEAEYLKLKGRFAEAIAAYERVIQERPDLAEPYFRLGVMYFNLGLKTKSEEYYLKAIEKDFKNPEIYFHLGYIKESEGKLQESLEWYLKAEEKGVGSAELYFNIGNVFARMANPERAIDYYKKAVSVNPKHMDSFINLSIISYNKGLYSDASFYLEKARGLGYEPPEQYLKALSDNSLVKERSL